MSSSRRVVEGAFSSTVVEESEILRWLADRRGGAGELAFPTPSLIDLALEDLAVACGVEGSLPITRADKRLREFIVQWTPCTNKRPRVHCLNVSQSVLMLPWRSNRKTRLLTKCGVQAAEWSGLHRVSFKNNNECEEQKPSTRCLRATSLK
jgi:hypothetical protein